MRVLLTIVEELHGEDQCGEGDDLGVNGIDMWFTKLAEGRSDLRKRSVEGKAFPPL